jgi:hypothetical protein
MPQQQHNKQRSLRSQEQVITFSENVFERMVLNDPDNFLKTDNA